MYLESLVYSSFCQSITQIRSKAQKNRYFFFKCDFLRSWLHECQSLKLSAVKSLFIRHTFSMQQGCPNWYIETSSEHHAEVLAALEAIWTITAVLSLGGACRLKHGQIHMTNSFLFVDGAQLVGGWDTAPCSNLLFLDSNKPVRMFSKCRYKLHDHA